MSSFSENGEQLKMDAKLKTLKKKAIRVSISSGFPIEKIISEVYCQQRCCEYNKIIFVTKPGIMGSNSPLAIRSYKPK